MARKREERSARNSQRSAKKSDQNNRQDPNFVSLKHQLVAMGLTLREIPGDGNCLFRALGDQLDGTTATHNKHRRLVVDYMRQHRGDFEPFVEDDVPFERHCNNLAQLGTYAGNDCIVAFARLHQVNVVIHQLNTPRWQINGTDGKKSVMELHISYHNGDHYNSVRRLGDCTSGPACVKLTITTLPCATVASPNTSLKALVQEEDEEDENKDFNGETFGESTFPPSPISAGEEELRRLEQELIEQTGCEDLKLVRAYLCAHDYEVREAADALINYIVHQHKGEQCYTSPGCFREEMDSYDSTTSSWLVVEAAGASSGPQHQCKTSPQEKIQQRLNSKQHLSNSKRKELKKQLRKHQADERKRHRQTGLESDNFPAEELEVTLVKDIGCLSI